MRRRLAIAIVVFVAVGPLVGALPTALAHECGYDESDPEACRETPVVPNWRDNYVPLFDLPDRDDPEQRREAQRWRQECEDDGEHRQICTWSYGGTSLVPGEGGEQAPNEWHAGLAATHCFLFEAAHQCEDHDASNGEGVHDAHGGAAWVSVCFTENPESAQCAEGMKGTEIGIVILDHNPCGLIVPIVSCIDEYHVIRPFDQGYTEQQMANSQESVGLIAANPRRYVCGFGPGSDSVWCGLVPGDG